MNVLRRSRVERARREILDAPTDKEAILLALKYEMGRDGVKVLHARRDAIRERLGGAA